MTMITEPPARGSDEPAITKIAQYARSVCREDEIALYAPSYLHVQRRGIGPIGSANILQIEDNTNRCGGVDGQVGYYIVIHALYTPIGLIDFAVKTLLLEMGASYLLVEGEVALITPVLTGLGYTYNKEPSKQYEYMTLVHLTKNNNESYVSFI